ncbi:hypothetical protein GDP17_05645 [Gordonia jinghuaiqii]|nr:hypothetical protein [Gordonia jinghuaiqii]
MAGAFVAGAFFAGAFLAVGFAGAVVAAFAAGASGSPWARSGPGASFATGPPAAGSVVVRVTGSLLGAAGDAAEPCFFRPGTSAVTASTAPVARDSACPVT